jgi:hypothetical protein
LFGLYVVTSGHKKKARNQGSGGRTGGGLVVSVYWVQDGLAILIDAFFTMSFFLFRGNV